MAAHDDIRFWHEERVRYRDTDMQQIVYFAKYLEYIDIALDEYFRSLGIAPGYSGASGELDSAAVHVELDYRAPARFDDLLTIGVRVSRLGRSSFDVIGRVHRARDGVLLCSGKLVMVNIDRDALKARPLPDMIRQAVGQFEGDALDFAE